jgi:hypothetical protein
MSPNKHSKEEVLINLIGQLELALVEEKVLSPENIKLGRKMYGLDNGRIITIIQNYVMKHYRTKQLKQWLLSEFELAHASASSINQEKLKEVANDHNVTAQHLDLAVQSAKEGVLNNKSLFNKVYITLNKICYVLDYKPPEGKTAVE